MTILSGSGNELCVDRIESTEGCQFHVLLHPIPLNLFLSKLRLFQTFHLANRKHVAGVLVHSTAIVGKTQLIHSPGSYNGESRQGKEPYDYVQRLVPKAAPAPIAISYAKFRSHSTFSKSVTSINTKTIAPAR